MKVSDEMLVRHGFKEKEIQKIKYNTEIYGGTLEDTIQHLVNKFRVALWIFYSSVIIFILVAFLKDFNYTISIAIGLIISMIFVVVFLHPVIISYKSWLYWKKYKKSIT